MLVDAAADDARRAARLHTARAPRVQRVRLFARRRAAYASDVLRYYCRRRVAIDEMPRLLYLHDIID